MKKLLITVMFVVGCGATGVNEVETLPNGPVPVPSVSLRGSPTPSVAPSPTPSPTETPDPFDSAISCNDSHTKYLMCHTSPGNPNEKDLKCLKRAAIESHLQNHPLDFLIVDHDSAEGCTENNDE